MSDALGSVENPPYINRQIGHKNAKRMLLTIQAKWIDGADCGRELEKPEEMLRNEKTAKKAV
ncbi:hypothetical protein G7047_14560 [Diaphorobacter sp. HDW4A]|uniref:hypothetical protein n=1 Tax=Diaphorobacter sp. HDW4A TaxID=2714924 RepID=UPI0014092846|nr:hypothetical protein [Diaphorobacter sp. HDW4A]QIL80980.1 hypothetical protein G7047_14560 [Diaphorobacter sp. HDW4A]